MRLIETTEHRCRWTGILFGYRDRYMLECEEDLKDYPKNRIGDCVEVRRSAPFEVRKFE